MAAGRRTAACLRKPSTGDRRLSQAAGTGAGITAAGAGTELLAGQRSLISPIPAHSRTASMAATADDLSPYAPDTASSVPSGAVSLNLYRASASTKTSNLPAITNPSGLRMVSAGSFAAKQAERISANIFRWSGRTIGIDRFIKCLKSVVAPCGLTRPIKLSPRKMHATDCGPPRRPGRRTLAE